jgi:hypothetical protein
MPKIQNAVVLKFASPDYPVLTMNFDVIKWDGFLYNLVDLFTSFQ